MGIERILLPPLAGVLSAYGIGVAKKCEMSELSIDRPLLEIYPKLSELIKKQEEKWSKHKGSAFKHKVYLRYQGSDMSLGIPFASLEEMQKTFAKDHKKSFGVVFYDRSLTVEMISTEFSVEDKVKPALNPLPKKQSGFEKKEIFINGSKQTAKLYKRSDLAGGQSLKGPALVIEDTATHLISKGWTGEVLSQGEIVLKKSRSPLKFAYSSNTINADPIKLEVIANRFMSIAEQMGITLERTAYSVNIKERMDFSCALFDQKGSLLANAPHIPVHLGSMGESVRALLDRDWQEGDVYILNDPYCGGTHLPDITAVTPIFCESKKAAFFVASRGHHADIGGITPGSMPPESKHIQEEGILIEPFLFYRNGKWREGELKEILMSGPYPVRNFKTKYCRSQGPDCGQSKRSERIY